MIEQYKKDKMNNVKFDGPLSPILTTMIPLKVNILYNNLVSLALIMTTWLQDYKLIYSI